MEFWKLIEASKSARITSDDLDGQIAQLANLLSEHSSEEIVEFEVELRRILHELYRGDIVDLCIMIDNDFRLVDDKVVFEDGISDEGFIYFRCWLILQGEKLIKTLADGIENIVDVSVDIADTWGEGLLYVADDAYFKIHPESPEFYVSTLISARENPDDYDSPDEELIGEPKYDDLASHYPRIAKRISEIKDELA